MRGLGEKEIDGRERTCGEIPQIINERKTGCRKEKKERLCDGRICDSILF